MQVNEFEMKMPGCVSFSSLPVRLSGGGRGWSEMGVMLQLLSHMLYSKNNIWRVTSGCGLQHNPRHMTNELLLAHILRSHLAL